MNKIIKLLIFLVVVSLFYGCGNQKSPTGGKVDKENPVIVSVIPEQYSNISDQNIEITFSKPIDRSSIYEGERGIHFYPFISNKRFRWSDNTLTIEINEPLEADRNYYMSLSKGIRDLRQNNLAQNYLFVFHSGRLQNNRISGHIKYERDEDMGRPVTFTLLSADSLRIFTKEVTGSRYVLENLDDEDYIIRAFIDKNSNQRYDIGDEPFYQVPFSTLHNNEIDIFLEYFDDSKPEIRSLRANFENLLTITFDKPVLSVSEINITSADTLKSNLEVMHYDILNENLEIITAPMDSLEYSVTLFNTEDLKGNVAPELERIFQGSVRKDTARPKIVSSTPRDGAVVNNLNPAIEIEFDKFMLEENIYFKIIDTITGEEIPTSIAGDNSRQFKLRPEKNLINRNSHRLSIMPETKDMNGNELEDDFVLQFLPITSDF